MANHKGSEGVVHVGGVAVAEIRDWSVEESAEVLDDTTMGDTWVTNCASLNSWTASINALWDETDTAQGAMTIGASVALIMFPEGTGVGANRFTGTALITSISRTGSYNGLVEASFSVTGTAALVESTS